MSGGSIASTAVLLHLHNWQRRAGVALTWPTFTSDAYADEWRALNLVLAEGSREGSDLTRATLEDQDQRRV